MYVIGNHLGTKAPLMKKYVRLAGR